LYYKEVCYDARSHERKKKGGNAYSHTQKEIRTQVLALETSKVISVP